MAGAKLHLIRIMFFAYVMIESSETLLRVSFRFRFRGQCFKSCRFFNAERIVNIITKDAGIFHAFQKGDKWFNYAVVSNAIFIK